MGFFCRVSMTATSVLNLAFSEHCYIPLQDFTEEKNPFTTLRVILPADRVTTNRQSDHLLASAFKRTATQHDKVKCRKIATYTAITSPRKNSTPNSLSDTCCQMPNLLLLYRVARKQAVGQLRVKGADVVLRVISQNFARFSNIFFTIRLNSKFGNTAITKGRISSCDISFW